jgi:hypothetical protein
MTLPPLSMNPAYSGVCGAAKVQSEGCYLEAAFQEASAISKVTARAQNVVAKAQEMRVRDERQCQTYVRLTFKLRKATASRADAATAVSIATDAHAAAKATALQVEEATMAADIRVATARQTAVACIAAERTATSRYWGWCPDIDGATKARMELKSAEIEATDGSAALAALRDECAVSGRWQRQATAALARAASRLGRTRSRECRVSSELAACREQLTDAVVAAVDAGLQSTYAAATTPGQGPSTSRDILHLDDWRQVCPS